MNTCPITLELIKEENVFLHAGTAFDVFALYSHLLSAVYMTNPVSRLPFTDADLLALEDKVRSLCGEDAITSEGSMIEDIDKENHNEIFDPGSYTGAEPNPNTPLSIELEVLPVITEELIRLQVRLNLSGQCPSGSYNNTPEPSEDDNDDFFEDPVSVDDPTELPPRRLFPSIVEMAHDPQRAQRLKARLDLLQYLNYDSKDTLLQIVSLSSDNHFHQMVWEQTSSTVFDTVQQLVGDQNRSVDVEVTYAECWDTYRARLLLLLNRKYTEIIQDIKRVDVAEAEMCVRGHINEVENNSFLTEERKSWIVSYLQQNV
jgi:hypothetical protein